MKKSGCGPCSRSVTSNAPNLPGLCSAPYRNTKSSTFCFAARINRSNQYGCLPHPSSFSPSAANVSYDSCAHVKQSPRKTVSSGKCSSDIAPHIRPAVAFDNRFPIGIRSPCCQYLSRPVTDWRALVGRRSLLRAPLPMEVLKNKNPQRANAASSLRRFRVSPFSSLFLS